MAITTRTATVTVKDLTNSTPAEAIQMATEENTFIVSALQTLDEADAPGAGPVEVKQTLQSFNAGERVIALSRSELVAVRRALMADLELNNGIIAAAHSATGESN